MVVRARLGARERPGRDRAGVPWPRHPRAFRDPEDWATLVEATTAAGELPDYTFLWWDIRLHPRLGTIEVRELDAQSSLDDVAALAALVRALAVEAAAAPDRVAEPSETLAWSAFRATRDGVEARILADGTLTSASPGGAGDGRAPATDRP